jgi:hypothetical protein
MPTPAPFLQYPSRRRRTALPILQRRGLLDRTRQMRFLSPIPRILFSHSHNLRMILCRPSLASSNIFLWRDLGQLVIIRCRALRCRPIKAPFITIRSLRRHILSPCLQPSVRREYLLQPGRFHQTQFSFRTPNHKLGVSHWFKYHIATVS